MSARRKRSNSAGVIGIGTAPCLPQFSLMSGEFSTLTTSALSFSTAGFGVSAGAMSPSQIVAS